MKKNWVLTEDAFEALLEWLHPNREEAGQKYEDIRLRLIKIFHLSRLLRLGRFS